MAPSDECLALGIRKRSRARGWTWGAGCLSAYPRGAEAELALLVPTACDHNELQHVGQGLYELAVDHGACA